MRIIDWIADVCSSDLSYTRAFAAIRAREPDAVGRHGSLVPALEVWARVQSRPEPGLALLTMGKRDCSYDVEPPVPELWYSPTRHDRPRPMPDGGRITRLNDQHAYLVLPEESPVEVGEPVACGISPPCTTFDKWQLLPVVYDRYDVFDAGRTFF